MSTDWYYLDKGEQQGPVSGNELRELADFETVMPWTSVRRIYKGESSPWTRAGAIQALFSKDVSDLLGPPICNDCGRAKPDGSCPNCEAEDVAPIQPEQSTEYVASEFPAWASTPLADGETKEDRETKNVCIVDINVYFSGFLVLDEMGVVDFENAKEIPIALLFLGMLAAAAIFGLSDMFDKKQ